MVGLYRKRFNSLYCSVGEVSEYEVRDGIHHDEGYKWTHSITEHLNFAQSGLAIFFSLNNLPFIIMQNNCSCRWGLPYITDCISLQTYTIETKCCDVWNIYTYIHWVSLWKQQIMLGMVLHCPQVLQSGNWLNIVESGMGMIRWETVLCVNCNSRAPYTSRPRELPLFYIYRTTAQHTYPTNITASVTLFPSRSHLSRRCNPPNQPHSYFQQWTRTRIPCENPEHGDHGCDCLTPPPDCIQTKSEGATQIHTMQRCE